MSAEAQDVLAAAREILATRIKHGDVLSSPGAVRDPMATFPTPDIPLSFIVRFLNGGLWPEAWRALLFAFGAPLFRHRGADAHRRLHAFGLGAAQLFCSTVQVVDYTA